MPLRTTVNTARELGITLMVLFAFPVFAECPDYTNAQPARLLENNDQNDRILKSVSELHGGEPVRVVKLGAYVNREGRIENICCVYSNSDLTTLQYRYYRIRLRDLRFSPAIHDGEPLHVFVSVSFVTTQVADQVESILLLNQLNSIAEFGINYSAPQRISSQYQRRIHSLMRYPIATELETVVGASGKVSNVEFTERNVERKRSEHTYGIARKLIENSCFVPGQVNNQATEMLYVEGLE